MTPGLHGIRQDCTEFRLSGGHRGGVCPILGIFSRLEIASQRVRSRNFWVRESHNFSAYGQRACVESATGEYFTLLQTMDGLVRPAWLFVRQASLRVYRPYACCPGSCFMATQLYNFLSDWSSQIHIHPSFHCSSPSYLLIVIEQQWLPKIHL
jgi:hypothetical protein